MNDFHSASYLITQKMYLLSIRKAEIDIFSFFYNFYLQNTSKSIEMFSARWMADRRPEGFHS